MEEKKNRFRRLPESELELMLVVWGAGGSATAPEILEALDQSLTASALHSYLKRLEEKGFLACRKEGKVNRYTAQVSKESYQRRESRSLLERFYHRSLKHLAAALYDGGDLSQGEIRELQEYLSELEKKEGE